MNYLTIPNPSSLNKNNSIIPRLHKQLLDHVSSFTIRQSPAKISRSIQQFSNITIKIPPTESSQFQQIKRALNQKQQNTYGDQTTGSALAAASDIHRKVPTYMANIRRDWLTNQNTDCCFVVIGLVGRQSHCPLQQPKIDPVCQMGPPYWFAPSRWQRIFINIRGQYGNQKNIYTHPWIGQNEV